MSERLGGVRKAFVSMGDDVTLTRFVKLETRHAKLPKAPPVKLGDGTIYPATVKPPSAFRRLLVSGHNNVKIGRDVRKGKLFRGYYIYTLSLEERRTCPSSCKHWKTCYGNNMPFAKRIEHGPELENRLEQEIVDLLSVRGRKGILIRLHALGDFYSVSYVKFWISMLCRYPRLAVYGYTARNRYLRIGAEIMQGKLLFGPRFAIRWSDGGRRDDCTVSIREARKAPPGSFVCPEQTGATACCATCGLCWNTTRNVAFIEH